MSKFSFFLFGRAVLAGVKPVPAFYPEIIWEPETLLISGPYDNNLWGHRGSPRWSLHLMDRCISSGNLRVQIL